MEILISEKDLHIIHVAHDITYRNMIHTKFKSFTYYQKVRKLKTEHRHPKGS